SGYARLVARGTSGTVRRRAGRPTRSECHQYTVYLAARSGIAVCIRTARWPCEPQISNPAPHREGEMQGATRSRSSAFGFYFTISEFGWLQSPSPFLVTGRYRNSMVAPGVRPETVVLACSVLGAASHLFAGYVL